MKMQILMQRVWGGARDSAFCISRDAKGVPRTSLGGAGDHRQVCWECHAYVMLCDGVITVEA